MNGKAWTEEELKYLKENYLILSNQQLSEYFGRTVRSLQSKMRDLGLYRCQSIAYQVNRNRLTVLEIFYNKELGSGKKRTKLARCLCVCGNIDVYNFAKVNIGRIKSCGCSKQSIKGEESPTFKHGLRKHRLYKIFHKMKARCYNKNSINYDRYGAKGITICEEWLNDFVKFYDWSIINGYQDNLTIDRKESTGNYCPENCKWSTYDEQSNNRSNVKYINAFGESKKIIEWIKDPRCVVKDRKVIRYRLNSGWDHEKILTTPVRINNQQQ